MNAHQPSPSLVIPPLASYSQSQLEDMLHAGVEVVECLRVLKKGGLNIVGELLKGQGTFYQFDHFPKGDVYDPETHSQYYYHAHRALSGEHGHFHTFLRASGMPAGTSPVAYDGDAEWPSGDSALSHLIAISMDKYGFPIGLFATNRWVTGETWYCAKDVTAFAHSFCMDHAYPSWPVNRWVSGMFGLFWPQIEALIAHRDEVIEHWTKRHPEVDVYEDRKLEITGSVSISIEQQVTNLHQALN